MLSSRAVSGLIHKQKVECLQRAEQTSLVRHLRCAARLPEIEFPGPLDLECAHKRRMTSSLSERAWNSWGTSNREVARAAGAWADWYCAINPIAPSIGSRAHGVIAFEPPIGLLAHSATPRSASHTGFRRRRRNGQAVVNEPGDGQPRSSASGDGGSDPIGSQPIIVTSISPPN